MWLAASWPSRAQQVSDEDTGLVIRSDSRLVVLHTTVVNRDGELVTDLTQSDFKVLEDGVEQSLKVFRQEDVPLSLGMLVDNSASMRDKRLQVNAAALDFVKASNPLDEVFIVNFNDEAFLDADFTAQIDRLKDGLERIDARGGTALYDATGMSLDHLSAKAKWDKRVLLIVTDGEDNASRSTLEKMVRRLDESDVSIYAVGLLGEEDRRAAKRAQRALRHMTRATGGAVFFPKSVDEVHAITQQVARDIRNQYILAYTPSETKGPGYRRVEINLMGKGKKYSARYRPGYYAQ